MFSGIVSNIGTIAKVQRRGDKSQSFTIACSYASEKLQVGDSIACSGVCLTITDIATDRENHGSLFSVDVSQETLSLTPAAHWQVGDEINLELSLKLGDTIGGHLVFGHVDGLAEIRAMTPQDGNLQIALAPPPSLLALIAKKGSIAIDGVSLTVNEVNSDNFTCMLIPHSLKHTTFKNRKIGDKCALEIDMLMRYVARLQEMKL